MSTSHHQEGGPIVAHHFDNLAQQQATVRLGMWLFLTTEVLFFGGVLCAYTAYRIWFPKEFEAGSTALNPLIAGINTLLLLASSFTSVLAIRAAYTGNQTALQMWIIATIILGVTFLGFKTREYYDDYKEGLIPNPAIVANEDEHGNPLPGTRSVFSFKAYEALQHKHYYHEKPERLQEVDLNRVQLFFMFYYSMTGLHVLHMIVGIGLWAWQLGLCYFGFFKHRERYVYIEVLALYWHFVEMVWIFLLPLLYMTGHHNVADLHL